MDLRPALTADADVVTRALVARAREGDAEAFGRLVGLAEPRLRLYLRVRMGPALRARVEPEDALQETWVAAHRGLEGFEDRGPDAFVRWLCGIAENVLRGLADHHGARKRSPAAGTAPASAAWALPAGTTGVATAVARREARDRVAEAVEGLPDDEREVLALRFFQGLSIDAIASLTTEAPTTVRRRLGRATMALGARLGSLA
jgi:RNA polymerase sigma-70 factor (ECF subfamily)